MENELQLTTAPMSNIRCLTPCKFSSCPNAYYTCKLRDLLKRGIVFVSNYVGFICVIKDIKSQLKTFILDRENERLIYAFHLRLLGIIIKLLKCEPSGTNARHHFGEQGSHNLTNCGFVV